MIQSPSSNLGFLETLWRREGEKERWFTGIKASPHTIKISLQLEINILAKNVKFLETVENTKAFRGGEKGSLGKINISAVAICLLKQTF